MTNTAFLIIITISLSVILILGVKYLPGERWQMLAIVPSRKTANGQWQGTNLTYYGLLIATSQLISISLLLTLLGAMHISIPGTILSTGLLLSICLPAAHVVAMIVEKKKHTFTIGGASFVGILLAPLAIVASKHLLNLFCDCYLPLMPVLGAMAIAYTLGEGLGRLACLSYGCCYGKPLCQCSSITQKLFSKAGTVFQGDTKKVEYESHLAGEKLIPIQAITCVLYTLTAINGSWLFLLGKFTAAFTSCMVITQIWRLLSEIFRADFRGFSKISAYQKMGLGAAFYSLIIASIQHPEISILPIISEGLSTLWNPAVLLGLQLTWILFFIYFGRSTVTSATVSFSLVHERI